MLLDNPCRFSFSSPCKRDPCMNTIAKTGIFNTFMVFKWLIHSITSDSIETQQYHYIKIPKYIHFNLHLLYHNSLLTDDDVNSPFIIKSSQ